MALTIELTTPACPVKEVFKNQANDFVKVRGRESKGVWRECEALSGGDFECKAFMCVGVARSDAYRAQDLVEGEVCVAPSSLLNHPSAS